MKRAKELETGQRRTPAIADVNNDNSLLASTTLHTRTYSIGCAAGSATNVAMQTFLVALNGDDQTNIALIGPYCSSSAVAMSHISLPQPLLFKARNCSINLIPDSIHAKPFMHSLANT